MLYLLVFPMILHISREMITDFGMPLRGLRARLAESLVFDKDYLDISPQISPGRNRKIRLLTTSFWQQISYRFVEQMT